MSKIYKRICEYCNTLYEGYGKQFCSHKCRLAWLHTNNRIALTERFWTKVNITNSGCWLWTGCLQPNGYGKINIGGKPKMAHRVAYKLSFGPIPKGQCVLHHCDNPSCTRPNHLFIGTKQDNYNDMITKGRKIVLKGESHGMHKLTEKDVLTIRSLKQQGKRQVDIAKQFDISTSTVCNIISRKLWKHI